MPIFAGAFACTSGHELVSSIGSNNLYGERNVECCQDRSFVVCGLFIGGLGAIGMPAQAHAQGWVAVAADSKGRWGYAFGERTSARAQAEALRGCGARGCDIQETARARCLAYVESRAGGYWYGVGLGRTQNAALSTARRGCGLGAPARTCRVVKAICG